MDSGTTLKKTVPVLGGQIDIDISVTIVTTEAATSTRIIVDRELRKLAEGALAELFRGRV